MPCLAGVTGGLPALRLLSEVCFGPKWYAVAGEYDGDPAALLTNEPSVRRQLQVNDGRV
jgi:hypothetical protein